MGFYRNARTAPQPTTLANPAWRKWAWRYIERTKWLADKQARETGVPVTWDKIYKSYKNSLSRAEFDALVSEFANATTATPPVIVTEITPPISPPPRSVPSPEPPISTDPPGTPVASPGIRTESTILQFNQNGQPVISTDTTVEESKFPWWILAVAAGMFILRNR